MSDDFVHLHLHDTYSAYDGVGLPKEFAERCAELGQPGFAQTNHGSLRGLFAGFEAAKKHGVGFVPGVEAYLADDISLRGLTPAEKGKIKANNKSLADEAIHKRCVGVHAERPLTSEAEIRAHFAELAAREIKKAQTARRERDHITLWAINDAGLKNLYKLNARAWSDGFYHKPRVDMRLLQKFADGVAASTGCPGGVVTTPIRFGDMRTAVKRATELADIFGDRLYCELMPHIPSEGDPDYARKLIRVAKRVEAKVIATQDAHFPFERDTHAQEVFLCIQRKEHIDDPNRGRFDGAGFWMTTRGETAAMLRENQPWLAEEQIQSALDETMAFFERCTARPHIGAPGSFLQGPPLPPEFATHQDWLEHLVMQAFRGRDFGAEYRERLLHEIGIIDERGFAEYILMVWELRAWARANGVTCGPGRGSGAGSLVCWLLGITGVDPVRHGLLFERFIDPNRPDYPDIDLDHDPEGADRVVEHLRELYGADRVVGISTHGMLGGRGTLRDLARVYRVSGKAIEPVAALVLDARGEETKSETSLGDVLRGTLPGRQFACEYPDVVAGVDRLEGNMRSAGSHPGGVIISSVPVTDVAPVESRADGGVRVPLIAYDMRAAERIGFVKLDNLRLSVLKMLAQFQKRTGINVEAVADIENREVLEAFTAGRFASVFQFDTASMRRLCRGFVFRGFDDVAVLNALNRPGPKKSGLGEQFLDCHMGRAAPTKIHPLWDAIFAGTYGVPVYQEQIIELVKTMCGYDVKEAAAFRRKVSKSKGVSDEYERFVGGAKQRGVEEQVADKVFDLIVGSGSYLFNMAHSYAYAMLAWWSMTAKVLSPNEFYLSALEVEQDKNARLRLAAEARRAGIPVTPPTIAFPDGGVRVVGGQPEIVVPITELKGIGRAAKKKAGDAVPTDLRGVAKLRSTSFTGGTFSVLAKACGLRDVFPHHRFAVVNAKLLWRRLQNGCVPRLRIGALEDYTSEERSRVVSEVWPLFVDSEGATALDRKASALRAKSFRRIGLLEEEDEDVGVGLRLVAARLVETRLFSDPKTGERSGKLVLSSADGAELSPRIDADVVDRCAAALIRGGEHVLCALWRGPRGGYSTEGVWPIDAPPAWLLEERRSKPADPMLATCNASGGGRFRGVGLTVFRRRDGRDKNGNPMSVFGLLGARTALRGYVFVYGLKRLKTKPSDICIGDVVSVSGVVMDGGSVKIASMEKV